MTLELTPKALAEAKFRGPVRFYDGAKGMARQDFQSVDEPRFGYFWSRKDRKDRGRQAYMVDGKEVADLDEACTLLAEPVDPDSPDQLLKREMDEFSASPSLNYGATRALSEARCNADGGPFGMMRAWMHRAGHVFHVGVNAHADRLRTARAEWPSWLYRVKSAAHETSRGMYLFAADRDKDTGLKCALGKRCRDCPILQDIETAMVASRTSKPFSYAIEDSDIDAAKVWTCIGHVLSTGQDIVDGGFFSTKRDREDHF